MGIPKKAPSPAPSLKALPSPKRQEQPPEDPATETQAPEQPQEPKLHWLARTLIQGIGAFMAGCAAGYAFCKAEEKFSAYGQSLFTKAMRMVDTEGRGHGGRSRWERSDGVSDRRRSGVDDPENDPMGDRGGSAFQEDDDL